jgi:hypothetical protein
VRLDSDPYTVASKQVSITGGTDLSYFNWLAFVLFSFALMEASVFGAGYFLFKKGSIK